MNALKKPGTDKVPETPRRDTAILVAGAGPAGLMSALLLARDGHRVVCIAPGPGHNNDLMPATSDARTTALMQGAIRLLERVGIWPDVAPRAAPLRHLKLIDDTGRLVPAGDAAFDCREIGVDAFGWNVPVADLVAALHRRAMAHENLAMIDGIIAGLNLSDTAVEAILADGARIGGSVMIAADGHRSRCREAAGIGCEIHPYDQTALVTIFDHELPHDDTSVEFHRRAGPLTLVPMPGDRSSLVWVETTARAAALEAMTDDDFVDALERATYCYFGEISNPTRRIAFPIRGLTARRFAANRTFLVGEAAHVLPPIGAQGLNLGLRDAALAAELVTQSVENGTDPGARPVLDTYDRRRRRDVLPRSLLTDLLNRTLLSDMLPAQGLRSLGLAMLNQAGPLRRFVMRQGMGNPADLPRLMQP